MPGIATHATKSQLSSPFEVLLERSVILDEGEVWPTATDHDSDGKYTVPLGVPLVPKSNGRYSTCPMAILAAAVASGDTTCTVDNADGFNTGDLIAALTTASVHTASWSGVTITSVDYTNNVIGFAAVTGANTNSYVVKNDVGSTSLQTDVVLLNQNVQTREDDTDMASPAIAVIRGQVDIPRLVAINSNCYSALLPILMPDMDFVPTTPGT